MVLSVRLCLEVFLWSDSLHPAKIIQHPHLCDVELGEEPVMIRWPIDHLRVSTEQSFPSKLPLCPVHLNHRSRKDNVSAKGTLRVEALLFAVIGLSQGHGQRCLRVYLNVLHGDLHAGQVHVGNPGARALRPVANREGVGERLSHHRLVAGDGGHGGPVTLVSDEAGDPGHLVVRRYPVPAGEGWGKGGPGKAKKEQTRSLQNSAHGWIQSLGDSRLV